MNDTVFKTYDIRGRVPQELVLDEIYDLGRALAVHAISSNPATKVAVIGMDGRLHSPLIKEELCRAFQDSGLDVWFLGICPTPLMYFALHTQPVDLGVMITASHNGPEYNGLKMCLNKDTIWGRGIERIKQLFKEKARLHPSHQGSYQDYPLHEQYIAWLINHFPHLVGMNLPLVIDCAHGATATIIPQLIEQFEWRHVTSLYATVDGTFPAHPANPVMYENMHAVSDALQEHNAACGIGFDGDGDRMAAMTPKGILVGGDTLLALFSESVITQHPGASVVFDIKCSGILPALLAEWGAQPIMSPSGHSIIKSELKKHHAILGGELSCHFFFNDRYFGYDDGIYAALRLIELLLLSRKTLDELLLCWPTCYTTPELRLPCSDDIQTLLIEQVKNYFNLFPDAQIITIDGVRIVLPHGTVIVRASHTEPVICVRWESITQEGFKQLSWDMEGLLKEHQLWQLTDMHHTSLLGKQL